MKPSRKQTRLGIAALAVSGAFALAVPAAHADIVLPSTLNTTFDTALGAGPFGTVNIAPIGVTSDFLVTFTANTAANFFLIDHNAADLNLNTSEFSSFTLVNTCSTCTLGLSLDTTGGSNVDSLGTFNLRTTLGNAAIDFSTLVFELDFTGLLATSPTQLLLANSGGFDAAAHVRLENGTGTPPTGFVGECTTTGCSPVPVPEPASLVIFGTALAGLGLIRRRRKSA